VSGGALWSYGAAAVAYLAFACLLAVSWRGRLNGVRLIAATAINAAWAGILALDHSFDLLPISGLLTAELIRGGAWLVVIGGLASSGRIARLALQGVYAACAAGIAFGVLSIMMPALAASATTVLLTSGLLLPLAAFVLLEQIYRNSDQNGRMALRPLLIGIGALFAYDLFLYSEAQLVHAIGEAAWVARGIVNVLCIPALAIAARRNPDWSLNVFVSRQVVFHTTTFISVGLYLIAVAAGGYLLVTLGGRWGTIAELVFLAGAAMVLAFLVASGSVRRRLRVFLSKHFYRNKYDYRVEWLRFVQTLARGEQEGDLPVRMVEAVAQIVGSDEGRLWIVQEEGRALVSTAAWRNDGRPASPMTGLQFDPALVEFLEKRAWVVDLQELRLSPEIYDGLRIPEVLASDSRWRILAPLLQGPRLVGLLMLTEPPPPFALTYEDLDLLKTVGRHLATYLALLESDRRLAESKQFEAFNRLTAFVMHDLKNLVAQLSLVVRNAERHRTNPAFVDDAIATIRNSTERMSRLIEQLQQGSSNRGQRRIQLAELVEKVVAQCGSRAPVPQLVVEGTVPNVLADPERLTMVVEHVVRNAQEATPERGRVDVTLQTEGTFAVVRITDTGEGMTAEFIRDRLFRPFDSTRGTKGMGIGAFQARDYIRSLGGDVAVVSTPGQGTEFTLRLPGAAGRE
jgi:putative PEP-CTERM system histidine kinase